jgi:hypothetical protein
MTYGAESLTKRLEAIEMACVKRDKNRIPLKASNIRMQINN